MVLKPLSSGSLDHVGLRAQNDSVVVESVHRRGNFEAGVLGLHGTETALQREVVFDRFFCGNTRRCREDVEDPSTMNCVRFLPEALTDTGTHGAEP